MTPAPPPSEPHRQNPGHQNPACHPDCRDPGCPRLRRLVDVALGSGCDRAFAVLDDIRAGDRNGCFCPRCRTRMLMLHLVLGCELTRISEQHEHPPRDRGP